MEFDGKFIWSADVDLDTLREIINRNFPKDKVAIKLDRLFFEKYGRQIIDEVQNLGIAVFADVKFAEISSKILELTKIYLEHRPWMLNVMANCSDNRFEPGVYYSDQKGSPCDILCQFAELCLAAGTKPCAVTVLTNKTPAATLQEYGKSRLEVVMDYANLAFKCGCTDVVCSADEAKNVSGISPLLGINTPAIRLPGSSSDDQSNVNTPAGAIANGATRLVIGRDLSRGKDFYGNLAKIKVNIEGGK